MLSFRVRQASEMKARVLTGCFNACNSMKLLRLDEFEVIVRRMCREGQSSSVFFAALKG